MMPQTIIQACPSGFGKIRRKLLNPFYKICGEALAALCRYSQKPLAALSQYSPTLIIQIPGD